MVLVAVEIACAIALVVVASLVTRSYGALTARPLGFEARDDRIVGAVTIGAARYQSDGARAAFFARSVERVRAIPGVRDAAWAFEAPFTRFESQRTFRLVGAHEAGDRALPVRTNPVGPQFFRTLDIAMRSGRVFDEHDTARAPGVVVVDEAFVRTYLRGSAPLGMRLAFTGQQPGVLGPAMTIVGVVANVRQSYAVPAQPTIYQPIAQAEPYIASLIVRNAPGIAVDDAITDAFRALDPRLVPPTVAALPELLAASAARSRLTMQTLIALAAVAFILALAGVYAVVGYGVAQRTREFGIRMALGAPARRIVRDVLVRAMATACVGIAAGVVLAGIAVRSLAITLYDIAPLDPATFGCVVSVVAVAALLAALVPAWRVTRVDPVVALRYD